MRHPAPSQETAGKTEPDAAENNSGGDGDHSRGTKAYLLTPCRQVVPLNENSTLSFLILTTCTPDMVSAIPGYFSQTWMHDASESTIYLSPEK